MINAVQPPDTRSHAGCPSSAAAPDIRPDGVVGKPAPGEVCDVLREKLRALRFRKAGLVEGRLFLTKSVDHRIVAVPTGVRSHKR